MSSTLFSFCFLIPICRGCHIDQIMTTHCQGPYFCLEPNHHNWGRNIPLCYLQSASQHSFFLFIHICMKRNWILRSSIAFAFWIFLTYFFWVNKSAISNVLTIANIEVFALFFTLIFFTRFLYILTGFASFTNSVLSSLECRRV